MFKRLIFPVILFVLGAAFFYWTQTSPFWLALRQVSGVMRLVHEDYVNADSVSYDRLAEEAMKGMVSSLDPYSRYLPVDEFAHFEELTRQRYVGIGVEIERVGDRVTVIEAFAGGPAEEAGVRPGDRIETVNGDAMADATVVEVSEALRGLEGEVAAMTVFRPSADEILEFTLERRGVDLDTVLDLALDEERIGYLRIRSFGERTDREFLAALQKLESQGLQGLIVDLRNNGGGLLSTSKSVAGAFFEKGELIVFTQGREMVSREEFRSVTAARPYAYPVVVLINHGSASGAEIVAGAWQDSGNAYVIGETSYGKGSVQSVYAFKRGGGMRQTTALYYLPSGRSIHEKGIEPDLEVKLSPEEERNRLLRARHRDYLTPEEFERVFETSSDAPDPQVDAAKEYLRERLADRPSRRV
jgi:carboxyl-terminal processing protease